MRNDYNDYHKLTNSLLSPLEAQRLAMNLRIIEQTRKAQERLPTWLLVLLLGIAFLYVAAFIIHTLLYW